MIKWMPSNNLVAQLAHFGWGALIVLAFALYGAHYWGIAGVLAYATPKEFIFDKYVEQQSFKDNLQDWLYWTLGMLAGVGMLALAVYIRRFPWSRF